MVLLGFLAISASSLHFFGFWSTSLLIGLLMVLAAATLLKDS